MVDFSLSEVEALFSSYMEKIEKNDGGSTALDVDQFVELCGELGVTFPDAQTAALVFRGFGMYEFLRVCFSSFCYSSWSLIGWWNAFRWEDRVA